MEHTKKAYNRKRAFEEFERCYKFSYCRMSEPRKWLTSRELELLKAFDSSIRQLFDEKRDCDEDVLSAHCDLDLDNDMETKLMRMVIYWLVETTLNESPKLKRWYYYEKQEKSLGVAFCESGAKLSVDWGINLKEYYTEEVWA